MWSKVRFGLILVLAYLFFLLANLPARQVLPRLSLPSGIEFAGVKGSIWQGELEQLIIRGIPVQDLQWQLAPLSLLLGQLDLTLQAGNPREASQVALDGQLAVSMDHIDSDGLQIYLPTEQVIARLPLPLPVKAGGRFKIQVNELTASQQGCQQLQGQGQWLKASVAGTQGPIELGQFDASLSCDNGALQIQVNEPNSFGLSATARIPANLKIQVNGRFKPDASLPQEVHDAARFFGQPDAQGYYQVRL